MSDRSRTLRVMRPSKYNAELLGPIVRASHSLAGVLRALGLRATGGNYRMISARIRVAGLDTTHFRGQGWARGQTKASNPAVARVAKRKLHERRRGICRV